MVFFMYWTGFTRKCVEDRHINVSEWHPQSPHLNIIGNKWQIMQVKLSEDAGSIRARTCSKIAVAMETAILR